MRRFLWPTGQVTPKFNKCRLKYRYPILYNVGYLNISRWFSGDRTLHPKKTEVFSQHVLMFLVQDMPLPDDHVLSMVEAGAVDRGCGWLMFCQPFTRVAPTNFWPMIPTGEEMVDCTLYFYYLVHVTLQM